MRVVKSFTNEPFESARVEDASQEHMDARWSARRWGIRFGPTLTLINGYGFTLVFLVGGWWVLFGPPLGVFSGTVTVGTVVMFLQYSRQIQGPMTQAGQLLNNFERVKASAERVFVLFDYPVSVPEASDPTVLEDVEGDVAFEDVSFSYPNGEQAITDVSFKADPGETIGLVGPTGSGKSTLMKLLLRFYDVSDGTVRVEATTSATSRWRVSARRSATSARSRSCSPGPSGRTSPMGLRSRTRRSARPQSEPTLTNSSPISKTGTRRRSARRATGCRAGSASGSRSRVSSCATPR